MVIKLYYIASAWLIVASSQLEFAIRSTVVANQIQHAMSSIKYVTIIIFLGYGYIALTGSISW